ncbi:unnamed protein product, partial [Ectocarpus sp. 12 AP-2014]
VSPRLTLALEGGELELADEGRILLLHPAADAELNALPNDRLLAVQPFRPDHDALERRGIAVAPALPDGETFAAAVVFQPRSKDLARALVALAAGATDGPVIVDGAKTDGIESLLKDLRRRVDLRGTLSKAHGKIAWFAADQGGPGFDDWAEVTSDVDRFRTRPGVFSADAVDPASALLAEHLPEKLGGHVIDAGAGWGFLSDR